MIRKYFDSAPVNTGRQPEVDLLKGFAVVFMVWVHVAGLLCADQTTLPYMIVWDVLGSPLAAPMFMISLGIGVCYSRRRDARHLAQRGFSLMGIALALNFARYVLPTWLSCHAVGEQYPFSLFFIDQFYNDILPFASFAFLFLAFAAKRNWTLGRMVLCSVLASLLAWALRGHSTGDLYADVLLGWLWGTGEYSLFPVLGWLIFPVAGVCIGEAMLRCRSKNSVYLRLSPVCLLIGAGYMWYAFATRTMYLAPEANYFLLSTVDALFIILLAIGLLGQNALLLRLLRGWRFPLLTRFSRNLNSIYCIHWPILMFFYYGCLFARRTFSFGQCALITAVLLAVSDILAMGYQAWKSRPAITVPRLTSRSLRMLNALLFAGGVSVQRIGKD